MFSEGFSLELDTILKKANDIAKDFNTHYVATEHIVYAMLITNCLAGKILKSCEVEFFTYAEYFNRLLDRDCELTGFTPGTKSIIEGATALAANIDGDGSLVGTEHLLLSILAARGCLAMQILRAIGVDTEGLAATLEKVMETR